MATISEDYVSFETAKLLKEKGFDELCDKKYYGDDYSGPSYIRERWEDGGDICPMSNSDLDDGSKYADISAPTLQMAMKWLRENYNIDIEIHVIRHLHHKWYSWFILSDKHTGANNKREESYEEACEAAIKYCLEDLI